MIEECSYGIIPFKKEDSVWKVLLIQHRNGHHWSFPKGHPKQDEGPLESAQRELREETGLTVVKWLTEGSFSEHYTFERADGTVSKSVSYFPALVSGHLQLQSEEIVEGRWVTVEQAFELITFDEGKALFRVAIEKIPLA